MLPSRDIMNTAQSIARYARTDRGRKVIGGSAYLAGLGLLGQSYMTNGYEMTDRFRAGGILGTAGFVTFASGMKSLRVR